VTGLRIKRVVFSLDARRLATRGRSPLSVSVPAISGAHVLTARVTFTDATRPASLRMRYRACSTARRALPNFTG
jgi:hypothetical protein